MYDNSALRTGIFLGCLLGLMWSTLVHSMFGPPCMAQLGLKYGSHDYSLTFDLAVSDGEPENVRLNGPKAWVPQNVSGSFVEINVSEPILLTGLQVQGDHTTGDSITGWLLDTSLDCETYRTQNYSTDVVGKGQTETVLMKNIEFVSCIRLRPRQYTGAKPALRLELLGCAVNDHTRCGRDVYPTSIIQMDDGSLQLNFDQGIVLDWVKVHLELAIQQNTFVQISYSRTCQRWKDYDPQDMNVVSFASSDKGSLWLTVEMEIPIRVKCLRVSPLLSATLREVYAHGCDSYLAPSLRELVTDKDPNINENGAETSEEIESTTDSSVRIEVTNTSTSISNVLPQESTEISVTTASDINEISNSLNSNLPNTNTSSDNSEVKNSSMNYNENKTASQEYSDIMNSSTITNESLLATTNPKEINTTSWMATSSEGSTGRTDTIEDITHAYDTSVKNYEDNNYVNQNSTTHVTSLNITDTNESSSENNVNYGKDVNSSSTVTRSHDMLQQPNITSSTYEADVEMLPSSESIQADPKYKDYNETVCGVKNSAKGARRKRVIGGTINTPGEWPWLVSMHYLIDFEFTLESGFKHTCGASLIASDWVITAAHCFSDDLLPGLSNLSCWRVYFGMHDLAMANSDPFVQERLIEAVYIYPNYNITVQPIHYDLALIKLNESVEINERVSPVCLDNDTDLYDGERPCYVSGWGRVKLTDPGSRYPHSAALSTITQSKCKDMYDLLPDDNEVKPHARIEPPVLCAAVGDNGEDACQGDSGGPLMCERDGYWYQAGIVVAGYQCGHKAAPGLYTRISYYSNWIRNIMELFDG